LFVKNGKFKDILRYIFLREGGKRKELENKSVYSFSKKKEHYKNKEKKKNRIVVE
jgi:hypothetical protein|tara:strand:- start:222 stop:386 length:165 start_codon:yes stop_codon:yes gene_type:complete